MKGNLIASAVLGAVAVAFIVWAALERLQRGSFSVGARIRVRVALIFLLVVAWLTWLRLHGA
jgi:type VI protein secretion system component VasK